MSDFQTALKSFSPVHVTPIQDGEIRARIAGLQARLVQDGIKAVWLDASTSLTYFTGLRLGLSERIHGALIPSAGPIIYITPNFERPKLETMIRIPGEIVVWEEHESPFALMAQVIANLPCAGSGLALDPATPFVFASALMQTVAGPVISAQPLIVAQRQIKSAAEIAIIQAAMSASLRVHAAVHAGLRAGISTTEVADFINAAHVALGMTPLFTAVQFGEATAYPHGVPYAQTLQDGDMVLVDLGAYLQGYPSDITRTYVFGTPTERQRALWEAEHRAQAAAFDAATLGQPCASVDAAARSSLTAEGFGPDYQVPGLPHRTGHGLGMDIHEEPFIVRGNETPLSPGMCFSIEPMLCVYGECGVRLEDIVYMTETGPRWFTEPAYSLDSPFGSSVS